MDGEGTRPRVTEGQRARRRAGARASCQAATSPAELLELFLSASRWNQEEAKHQLVGKQEQCIPQKHDVVLFVSPLACLPTFSRLN
ncbi:hypothetical protein NDU88_001717 [Pleurodeles waltl]|uniref:Uncharacterized protein n=1 Tax=Pleurodeles waltl TaxID=8319 RepID=A0AAV7U8V5_PLEWA|nr:hypothetical protein NDU88_001717 [Pleurodeles waltl]